MGTPSGSTLDLLAPYCAAQVDSCGSTMRQEVAAAFLHGVEFAFPEGKDNVRVSPLIMLTDIPHMDGAHPRLGARIRPSDLAGKRFAGHWAGRAPP